MGHAAFACQARGGRWRDNGRVSRTASARAVPTDRPQGSRWVVPRLAPRAVVVVLVLLAAIALPPLALAADDPQLPPLTPQSLLLGWQFDPTVWVPALAAVGLWWLGVRRVAARGRRIAPGRTFAWLAGIGVVVVALVSGIGLYDDILFSDHMVQHLLLILAAPPLLLLAGPVTLMLQAASPRVRRRWILPVLHARALGVVAHPVVAGVVFTLVMWVSHVSPVFEAALENPTIHDAEHLAYLSSALLLWWPVIGRDPSPWRLSPAAGAIYIGLQMPQMAFLAVSILMAPEPLYATYANAARTWGPTPLADQQLAAGIMWIGGSVAFLGTVLVLVGRWMRDEDRRSVIEDRRLDEEAAALELRERAAASGVTLGPDARQASSGTEAARYSR
jgi:cytochrome c oxidase assembly factor CtaG